MLDGCRISDLHLRGPCNLNFGLFFIIIIKPLKSHCIQFEDRPATAKEFHTCSQLSMYLPMYQLSLYPRCIMLQVPLVQKYPCVTSASASSLAFVVQFPLKEYLTLCHHSFYVPAASTPSHAPASMFISCSRPLVSTAMGGGR